MAIKSYLHLNLPFPVGIRNNNPGNLAVSGATFQGVTTRPNVGRGGEFFAFKTMAYGMLACIQTVQGAVHRGYDTLTKLGNRYAPASEGNNTKLWIRQVGSYAGIRNANAPLQLDPDNLKRLVMAIINKETGLVWNRGGVRATITEQDYYDGLELLSPPAPELLATLTPDVVVNPLPMSRPPKFVPQMVL